MVSKPDYFKLAAGHIYNKALLVTLVIGGVAGLWRGSVWPLLFFAAAEVAYLVIVPRHPAFRRACDRAGADERAHRAAVEREKAASRLSPNARSRLDHVMRVRQKILDGMRTLPAAEALLAEWVPRLDGVTGAALRLLVLLDSNRADDRDLRFLEGEVERLESEVAGAGQGPAAQAKAQRLELAKKRLADFGNLAGQREAAVVQLETLEDLLQELLARGLTDRDVGAFGQRMELLQAQIEGAGQSMAALEAHGAVEDELAVLRSTR